MVPLLISKVGVLFPLDTLHTCLIYLFWLFLISPSPCSHLGAVSNLNLVPCMATPFLSTFKNEFLYQLVYGLWLHCEDNFLLLTSFKRMLLVVCIIYMSWEEFIVVKTLCSKDKSMLYSTWIPCCLYRFLILETLWLVNNSESEPVQLWIRSHVLRLLLGVNINMIWACVVFFFAVVLPLFLFLGLLSI